MLEEPVVEESATMLVTVERYRDLHEALLAKARLELAEIFCQLADENVVRADWFYSNAVGGVRLQVLERDCDAARAILQEAIPEQFAWDGEDEPFVQPRCPRCQSLDIRFETLNRPWTFLPMFLLGFTVPVRRERWACGACDAHWVDD